LATIEISDEAAADLDDIGVYSIATFGGPVAVAYMQGFKQAFALLSEHPRIGALHEDIDPPIHSLPHRSHRIYYDIDGDRVIIQRILHKSQDAEQWLL
jgi:toxin ParE1/3/4